MPTKKQRRAAKSQEQDVSRTSNVDLVNLKLLKIKAKTSFTKSRHSLLRVIDDNVGKIEMKQYQQRMEDAFETLNANLTELLNVYTELEDEIQQSKTLDELGTADGEFSEVCNRVQRYLDKINSSIRDNKSQISSIKEVVRTPSLDQQLNSLHISGPSSQQDYLDAEGKDSHSQSNTTQLGTDMWKQLNRVSIPTFAGDKKLYHSWKAAFYTCVDSAPATAEYKLLQLRQNLRGEALKVVENLGHSAFAYQAAKERLERKFGGMRRQVAMHLEELDLFRPIRPGVAKDIEKLADLLDVLVINLKEAGHIEELGNGTLYIKVQKKLTEFMLTNYQRWIHERQKVESVEHLREWILQEAEFQAVASETIRGLGTRSHVGNNHMGGFTHFGQTRPLHSSQENKFKKSTKPSQACVLCTETHPIWTCDRFKVMEVGERWEVSKNNKLCYRCLGLYHLGANCPRSRKCGVDGCVELHNRLLHTDKKQGGFNEGEQTPSAMTMTTTQESQQDQRVALRTIPVILKNGDRCLTVNALLDDGSTKSYINSDVAAELGASGECETITVGTLSGGRRTFGTRRVNFELKSLDGATSYMIDAYTTTRVTGDMQVVEWSKIAQNWTHLKTIQFPHVGQKTTVDLLIGVDQPQLHRALQEVTGRPGEPLARLTPLGWTCIGKTNYALKKGDTNRSFFSRETIEEYSMADVNQTLEKFWQIEELGEVPTNAHLSATEQDAFNMVQKSLKRVTDQDTTISRYQVSVPWKSDPRLLPNNYDAARKRLESTERALAKQGKQVKEAYNCIIENHVKKGYITKVDALCNGDNAKTGVWYLPHFAISRPDKETTKLRIVFDAAARYQGVALNDVIHKGPNLQRSLFDVLMRFRRAPVALVCDVAEMYLQIQLDPNDRPYHRFLWRTNGVATPEVYQFNRLVFGINSCPFQAQFVTREHAEKNCEQLPAAAEAVIQSTYMDDTMDSTNSIQDGIQLYKQLSTMWESAGMHARKWLSNSHEVLKEIPECDRASEVDLDRGHLPSIKTLGLLWKADKDMFTFKSQTLSQQINITKRTFLGQVAQLFDPLGLVSPYVARAKMLLQEVWLSDASWDDQLSDELTSKIQNWIMELSETSNIQVPRCLQENEAVIDIELHIFADASQEAYAAVAYQRCEYENGKVTVRLIASKSKVAPLKTVSIPRLELIAATLGVRLAKPIAKSLKIAKNKISYWTDSMNVLWWISRRSRIMKTFVANRVAKIQTESNAVQWRHVATDQNPADVASRGSTVAELRNNMLWWNGPAFLKFHEGEWPTTSQPLPTREASLELVQSKTATDCETTFINHMLTIDNSSRLDPSKFSSWNHLKRILSWTTRFVDNARTTRDQRIAGSLSTDELMDSEIKLIKMAQMKGFHVEYKLLSTKRTIDATSKLISLQPFMDEDGLIRANSRLRYADYLSYDTRFPIILPRKEWITKLIVRSHHERDGHAMGTNHTLSSISERYWILQAREEIRDIENECPMCKRRKVKSAKQIMAPLPRIRVKEPLRAFGRVAVDYAGPFLAIQGRGRVRAKRYLCLFTCLMTRAVHLEMAYSLDTDAFMNAFFRMTSRRGRPDEVISDNGSNFVGAARELRELVALLDHDKIRNATVDLGIKWSFNPPLAPHFGGVHETMIKSAKRAIYAILGNADVNDEELMSAIVGAESLVNSRPLTYQSADPKDDLPLTPNHFLHGNAGGEFAPSTVDGTQFNQRKRWRRVQELVRHFWHRWLREWLPALGKRKKWNQIESNIKVNDIVLVIDPNAPRAQWHVGRIVETYPGEDGFVRAVKVRMKGTDYVRSISRVCLLESMT